MKSIINWWVAVALWGAVIVAGMLLAAHAADSKPFLVHIESDVAHHCNIGFDDPRMAMGWVMLLGGKLTAEQYLDVVRAVHDGDEDLDKIVAIVGAGIKVCVTGDSA